MSLILTKYPGGCVKISPNVSILHETVKMQVAHYLLKSGFEVWSEANLRGRIGLVRPDLVAIHPGGRAVIVEVLCSESEERYSQKEQNYPEDFEMVRIDTDDFDYDTLAI